MQSKNLFVASSGGTLAIVRLEEKQAYMFLIRVGSLNFSALVEMPDPIQSISLFDDVLCVTLASPSKIYSEIYRINSEQGSIFKTQQISCEVLAHNSSFFLAHDGLHSFTDPNFKISFKSQCISGFSTKSYFLAFLIDGSLQKIDIQSKTVKEIKGEKRVKMATSECVVLEDESEFRVIKDEKIVKKLQKSNNEQYFFQDGQVFVLEKTAGEIKQIPLDAPGQEQIQYVLKIDKSLQILGMYACAEGVWAHVGVGGQEGVAKVV